MLYIKKFGDHNYSQIKVFVRGQGFVVLNGEPVRTHEGQVVSFTGTFLDVREDGGNYAWPVSRIFSGGVKQVSRERITSINKEEMKTAQELAHCYKGDMRINKFREVGLSHLLPLVVKTA